MAEVRFVRYNDEKDNAPKQSVLSREEFYLYLSEHDEIDCAPCKKHDCPKKSGAAWAPGWIPEGRKRQGANVESFDVIGFDFDAQSEEDFESFCERIDGFDCLLHSTHSHNPPFSYSVRLVCSLSRRILVSEYQSLWHACVAKYDLPADKKAKDPARIFFMPSCTRGAPRINIRSEGKPLDVDELLRGQLDRGMQQRRTTLLPKEPVTESEKVVDGDAVDMNGLKGHLRRALPNIADEDDANAVRNLLAGKPLADRGGRDRAVYFVATEAARRIPVDTATDAVMEMLRPSIVSMPREDDDGPEENPEGWMKKARSVFEKKAQEVRETYEENRRGNVLLIEKIREWQQKNAPPPMKSFPGDQPQSDVDDETWRTKLKCKVLRDGSRLPENIGMNAAVVLEHHPAWKGVLRFNEVTKGVDCFGGPLQAEDRTDAQLLSAVDYWLQGEIGLVLRPGAVQDALFYIARRCSYDPIAEDLRKLPPWDGESRLSFMLERYFGVRLIDRDIDLTGYVRAVSVWMLIAAVARALDPGCKVDTVFVLEGKQSAFKSTALDVLSGGWFTELHLNLSDKDTKLLIARNWFIELAELSSLRKGEVEAQKAFFSQRVDQFRPPYGRIIEAFKRRSICVGTTNDLDYLLDITGNRRFLPVYCEKIDIEALRRDRDMLFAEALVRYQRCERWWPTSEEAEDIDTILNPRLNAAGYDDVILDWWQKMDPSRRPTEFTLTDIAVEALGLPKHAVDNKQKLIGRALKKLGFARTRKREGFSLCWVYKPTDELLNAAKVESRFLGRVRTIGNGVANGNGVVSKANGKGDVAVEPAVERPA